MVAAAAVTVFAAVAVTVSMLTSREQESPLYFGLAVPKADPAVQEDLARRIGVSPSLVGMFVKLDDGFTARDLTTRVGTSGMTPLVTLEPWSWSARSGQLDPRYSLRALFRGDHDTALNRIADELRAYSKPVYLRFAHEMNGDWYPWAEGVNGNRPGQYAAAWRHVHDLFADQRATNVRWIWAPNVVGQLRAGAPSMASLYPGDAYVTFVGLTGYGREPTAADTFAESVALLEAITAKPIVLAETGASGPTKTGWIRSLGPWLDAHPRVLAIVWFNTDPDSVPGATGDYRLDDTPARLTAFRTMLTGLHRLAAT